MMSSFPSGRKAPTFLLPKKVHFSASVSMSLSLRLIPISLTLTDMLKLKTNEGYFTGNITVTSSKNTFSATYNVAYDAAGNLTYLATSPVNLRLTEERWPKLTFHATREHSVSLTG